MISPELLLERTGGVLRVTFHRPHSLNAFTVAMMADAAFALEAAADDQSVRAVLMTGAGRAFSAGADLSRPAVGDQALQAANRLTRAIRALPKPVVAAINGPAVGVACSFAVAADLSIAKQSAYFLLAFADMGLMPDGGATLLIPTAIGRVRATRMALLGERIPAELAAEWGLITRVVSDDRFDAEVDALTRRLSVGPTQAYARFKQTLNTLTLPSLERAFELEYEGQTALLASSDFGAGVAAFREKRAPTFTGS